VRSRAHAYLVALAATLAAVLVRSLLDPLMGDTLPLVTLYGAIAVAVWAGGTRPALLASVLGYLACSYLFIQPRGALGLDEPRNLVGLAAYLITSAIIIGFGATLWEARRRAELGEETLRATFASMGDAVIRTDSQGTITALNTIAEDLTGWRHAEAVGRPLREVFCIIAEGSRRPAEDPVTRALSEGVIVGLANHTLLIRKDGTESPIDDSAAPIRDRDGNVVGCVLIFRDVSERRHLERQVADQLAGARFLASIIESSQDAIIGKSLDGTIQSWNPAAERLFGHPSEEALGRPSTLLVPPERAEEEGRILERLRAGERVEHLDTVRLRKDGGTIDVSLTISPIRDESGRVVGASKIARDITERVRAERAIRTRNERLRLLAEAAGVLLSTKDADAMLRGLFEKIGPHLGVDAYFNYMVNEAGDGLRLVSCAGVPEGAVPGLRQLEFGQAVCGMVALHRESIHATDVQGSDDPRVELVRSFGLRAYACEPLMSGGRLLGTLSFGSRTKDLFGPDDLLFLQTISHYVGLAYERLRLMDRLQEADRRKDEFLVTLAHELRGPLAPMGNMVEVMKRAVEGPDLLLQARETMGRQLAQLVRLVDDLLDVGRITRNKLVLRKDKVELAKVVQHAVETCQPLAESGGLTLEVSLPAGPIVLDADPARLSQVFSNLLNNACKYTEGGGHVWLSATRQGDEVRVSVKDTGLGIPAEMLGGIFEFFSQLDGSLERSQGGLGIGLTLASRLVEMHGGTIQAHSEGPGRGSEFVVHLPIAAEAARDREGEVMDDSGKSPSRRVLVVDDNQDSAMSMAMLLKMSGHETQMAHDGQKAIEVAETFRPEVVLLDIGLPKINGYEACRQIREQAWGRDMTLVAVTGWGQESDRKKSREAGFDHHMVKPVDFDSLTKVLADGPRKE
jgi:PAS domain S-box-containing protein